MSLGVLRQWLLSFGAAGCALACVSGQTGSPECALMKSCVCESMEQVDLYHAQVLTVADDELRVEVVEVLGTASRQPAATSGDMVSGLYSVGLPCSSPRSETIAPGDELLVARSLGTESQGELWVFPWGDELALSSDIQVAASEVGDLVIPEVCEQRFPGRASDCDDVKESGCAVAAGGVGAVVSGRPVGWVLLFAFLLLMRRSLKRLAADPTTQAASAHGRSRQNKLDGKAVVGDKSKSE